MGIAKDAINPAEWTLAIKEILDLHEGILCHVRTSIDSAIRIGEILTHIKAALRHGEWLSWVEQCVPFTEKTAQRYMRCFENSEKLKSDTVSNFRDAFALIASSNGSQSPNEPQKLHEPNFHSQAVRLRQNLIGLFNHYLQRRPLKQWDTEEIYDLACSLKPLGDVVVQLEAELSTRNDLPTAYRDAYTR